MTAIGSAAPTGAGGRKSDGAGLGAEAATWLRDFYRRFSAEGKAAALAAFAAEPSANDAGRLRAFLSDFLGKQKRGLLTRPLA